MADTVVVLSERDAVTLKFFLDRLRRDTEKVSTSREFKDDSDYLPPEVYLAKVPPGGIPAANGDTMGSADCDIYRAVPSSGGQTEKVGYSKTIYNPGDTAAPADSLALVARDKFGSWYCLGQGGGGGLSGVTVEGIALIPSAPASSPVDGVTTLDFDPNAGFVISSPSSSLAQVTIKSAGTANYGVVTNSITTAQTFAGDKYFQNQVQFNSKIVGVSDYSQPAPSGARYVLSQQGGQGETDGILWGFEGSLFAGAWTIAGSGNMVMACNTGSYLTGTFVGTRVSVRLGNEQDTLFGVTQGPFTQFPGLTLILDASTTAISNGLTHCYKISDPATPSTVYPGLWQTVTVGTVNLVFKGGIFVGTSTTAGATTTAAATTTTTTATGATTTTTTTTAAGATTTTTQATTTTTAGGGGGSPTITGVSPNTAPHSTPTSITITGTNFTGATAVKFGPTPAQSFTVNSSTQITATTPLLANSQTVPLTVVTPSGTSSSVTFVFT